MTNIWQQLHKPIMALAPMEDVTDVVFRQVIRECGAPDLLFTEFTSVEGMFSPGAENVMQRLQYKEEERPIIAQIWGTAPENYYKGAQEIVNMGFDGVDINLGCPVKKITKQGACSALIDQPTKAKEIIQAVKEATQKRIPVSVKTRMGFQTKKTEEWTQLLLEQDIAALTMHGRIAKHMSKYPADWEEVAKVVKLRNQLQKDTIIMGNGDITSLEDAYQKVDQSGVDGVMIGRGIFQDPFLFNPKRSITTLSVKEKLELLLRHAQLFSETWGEEKDFRILRRFFKIYARDFAEASDLRVKLLETENYAQAKRVITDFLNNYTT